MRLTAGLMIGGAALALALAGCSKASNTEAKKVDAGKAAPAVSGMSNLPVPRAGKWKMTMTMSMMPQPVVTEMCLTPAMLTQVWTNQTQKEAGVACSQNSARRDGLDVVGHSVCTMNKMTVTTDSRSSGDFNSRYTTTVTSRMDPAPNPRMAVSTTSIVAERLGDC
ncbi:MAG: DUF3617 domain-containing protein [Caulobacteraceae bacterium]